jgi:hypothetical protein
MRVVIDIPDETFSVGLDARARAGRYLRVVAAKITYGDDSSGLAPIAPETTNPDHIAGWAVEGSPWQAIDNEKEMCP